LDHPEEARQLLDRVLAADPHNALALGERGRLALQFESPAEAEAWLRRALKEHPAERELLYSLLQCLQQQGKRKEAEDLRKHLAQVEADLARLNELTRQIGSHPHSAELRYEAGQIMLRNGQETEGLRWLISALQEDPSHAGARQALDRYQPRDAMTTANGEKKAP
jgi:predicted Zn-dependent protease